MGRSEWVRRPARLVGLAAERGVSSEALDRARRADAWIEEQQR